MELIKKQHDFVTDLQHIEYLKILKTCMENYLDKKFVVSKKLHAKKIEKRHSDDVKNDIQILKNINYTIASYSN